MASCFASERDRMTKSVKPAKEDRRLARLTKICMALPEATTYRHGSHAGFLVRKRTFAYFLNDHHGDGILAVTCKVLPGDNKALAAAQPERFYLPAYLAPHGWVALRLDVGEVDWGEASELVACSYQLVAPKRLAALLNEKPKAAP
jgi:phosphoribosylglycinamide formyltransferase-1